MSKKDLHIFINFHILLNENCSFYDNNSKMIYDDLMKYIADSDTPPDAVTISRYYQGKEIVPYFKKFTEFCNSSNIKYSILSENFDLPVNSFLEKHGIVPTMIICNSLAFDGNSTTIKYKHRNESCTCNYDFCKRNAVINNVSDSAILIYIGEYESDICPAEHCDVVFAKGDLAKLCNSRNVPHHPFKTFFDINKLLPDLVAKGRIGRRQQAKHLRKQAFESE